MKGAWYHYKQDEPRLSGLQQASVYNLGQLTGLKDVIVPLNINNVLFAHPLFKRTVYFRSVFDRGRLLKQGYTIKDCLSFVKRHKNDGVIVGVNTEKELQEVLKAI